MGENGVSIRNKSDLSDFLIMLGIVKRPSNCGSFPERPEGGFPRDTESIIPLLRRAAGRMLMMMIRQGRSIGVNPFSRTFGGGEVKSRKSTSS